MRKFESEDLQQRYNTDEGFRKKVHSSEQEYYMLRKKANEMKPEQVLPESFLEKFLRKDSTPVYFMYGYMQPTPGKHTSKLTLNFMANFKPDLTERFSFVYFNQLTPSSDYFKEFKNIFMLIPHSFLQKMDAFVLVKPSFYLKALNYLAIANSGGLFKKSYFTVESCQELCEKLKISVQDFVSFVPEEYSLEFPEKYKRNPTLQSYRVNYFGQNLTESQSFQKSQFQGTINALISKEVYKLENYELGELGVPVVLEMLIFYFKGKPEGLSTEGIFRKSVAVDEEQQTYLQLSKRNYQFLESINNPHVIASLIKKFFNNLKEPIVNFALFKQLMEDQAYIDKRQHLKGIINKLPKLNFITLAFLIDFLKKDVISRQKENKMSANNIAICFSPCLFRSEVSSMADLVYASKSVIYSNLLITEFDHIFGNEEQRNCMFKSNVIEHNQIFQQTIREELQFDDEPEDNYNKPYIRGTESMMMGEDGIIEEPNRNTFLLESIINQSEVKPSAFQHRKLSDKIDELSNQIKEIQRRFTARKQSNSGSDAVHETFFQSRVNIKVEEDQTVLLNIQFQEEMQPINTSISSSKISLNYSNTPSESFQPQPQPQPTKPIPSKQQKATTLFTWQSLKKGNSNDFLP